MRLVHSKVSSVRLAERARIALLAAQGLQNLQIAQELGVDRIKAGRWRQRYIESGIAGIERDLPRGAPPAKMDVAKLVELTTQTKLGEYLSHHNTNPPSRSSGPRVPATSCRRSFAPTPG